MKGKQLTEKQKAFADKYIETGNATEAYKSAYSTSKMSDQVIYNEASKTIRKPLVYYPVSLGMKLAQRKITLSTKVLSRLIRDETPLHVFIFHNLSQTVIYQLLIKNL